jgi:crotonobetainyl-CoA:carnitine CoA-transferase CaiB-like acyl-CoA transferase
VPPPRAQAGQLAGTHAAIAAMLALLARERTGSGQLAEVSVQEAVAATLETGAISWIHARTVPGRTSGVYAHVAHRVFAAKDGYVAGGYNGPPRMWDDLLAWMAETGEAADLTTTAGRTRRIAGRAGRTSTRSSPVWFPDALWTKSLVRPEPGHCPGQPLPPRTT